jgi:hypothetical protein
MEWWWYHARDHRPAFGGCHLPGFDQGPARAPAAPDEPRDGGAPLSECHSDWGAQGPRRSLACNNRAHVMQQERIREDSVTAIADPMMSPAGALRMVNARWHTPGGER